MWMPVFPAIFEHVAGNSVDGSATQLPAILLAVLLGVNAPLNVRTVCGRTSNTLHYNIPALFREVRLI